MSNLPSPASLDRKDPLRRFRRKFHIPKDTIYLEGNSLGLMPREAKRNVIQALYEWENLAIGGWGKATPPWFYLPERLGEMMAPLVGGKPEEVIVANSTSVNLHQIIATFFKPSGDRTSILVEEGLFPTDSYVVQSQLALHGLPRYSNVLIIPRGDDRQLYESTIIAAMDEQKDRIGMLVLPVVTYSTGQLLDVELITMEAHKRGIFVCFDASHSIGSVPHRFREWGVDAAVWCSYKHLNGGPGAVAGMYVNERYHGTTPGLAGWFGSDKKKQFNMEPIPTFATDAGAYQIGTSHILSLVPLLASLEMFHEAGIDMVRAKSVLLTQYMIDLIDEKLYGRGFTLVTPRDITRRGGHVTLAHPEATRINKALKAYGIVTDFREPDLMRLAPVALYNSYQDVFDAVLTLRNLMLSRKYKDYPAGRDLIA